MRINRILCPVDFSDFSRRALDYAVAVARWYAARITALYVHPIGIPSAAMAPGAPMVIEPVVLSAVDRGLLLKELHAFVDAERAAGVGIDVELTEGNVWREVAARADAGPADLLVLGTHGRTGFERLVLGSVTEKLLRKVRCPVLTVPAAAPAAVPVAPAVFTRIVCGTDFSEASLRALEWALSLAQEADASLTLVHALDFSGFPGVDGMPVLPQDDYRLSYERWAAERMKAIVPQAVREYCRIDEIVATGRPHQQLLQIAAERESDLIVLGSAGHGPIERAFIGSTVQHVVRAARCPVLTVTAS